MKYGCELKLDIANPQDQRNLLGDKLLEFPPMTLGHLGERIKKIRNQLSMLSMHLPMIY